MRWLVGMNQLYVSSDGSAKDGTDDKGAGAAIVHPSEEVMSFHKPTGSKCSCTTAELHEMLFGLNKAKPENSFISALLDSKAVIERIKRGFNSQDEEIGKYGENSKNSQIQEYK